MSDSEIQDWIKKVKKQLTGMTIAGAISFCSLVGWFLYNNVSFPKDRQAIAEVKSIALETNKKVWDLITAQIKMETHTADSDKKLDDMISDQKKLSEQLFELMKHLN